MAGNTTRSEATQSFFVFIRDVATGLVRRVAIPSDLQVGLAGRPAELQLFGRLSVAATTVAINATNKGVINISNDDTVLAVSLVVTPASGRIRAHLPPTPREGQVHFIKDLTGTASGVPIDVVPPRDITIDNQTSKSLSDDYGSLALVWLQGQWRMLVAGLGASGGAGSSAAASYVTIDPEGSLTNERHLEGSSNVLVTDRGPNAAVRLDLSTMGSPGGTYSYATLTVDAYGRVTAASSGVAPTSPSASYVTISNEPSLTHERALAYGTGIHGTDGGAGSSLTLAVDDNVVATISGSRFTGPVYAAGGLSGSLQRLDSGLTYLVAGSNVTIVTASNGQVTVSSTGGGGGGGSALPLMVHLPIVAGSQVVDQSVFQAVGAFEFNPSGAESMAPSGSVSYTAYFQPIVEIFPTGVTLETQLYNVNMNSYVSGSLLSSSLMGATRLRSGDLASTLATGSNVYEMHLRVTNARVGKAVCKGAKLLVTWV